MNNFVHTRTEKPVDSTDSMDNAARCLSKELSIGGRECGRKKTTRKI
jgi:hypothetical protein